MFRARLILPAEFEESDLALLGEALSDLSDAHVALRENHAKDAPWILEWVLEARPANVNDLSARLYVQGEINSIPLGKLNWQIEEIPQTDWLAHSYKQFPAFSVGPFFIYGSHYDSTVPDGQITLLIDAATAFGSGEHGTTKGCLLAMLDLKDRGQCPWNVLDMGTGSGILAIAAWKLWKTPILAVDNDTEAVRVAAHHGRVNDVQESPSTISYACGEGFKTPEVVQKKPFDLIIANILAGPLIEMAQELTAVTDENGYVILSGMLNEQADDVLAAYEALGFTLHKRYDIGEWSSLLLHNAKA